MITVDPAADAVEAAGDPADAADPMMSNRRPAAAFGRGRIVPTVSRTRSQWAPSRPTDAGSRGGAS